MQRPIKERIEPHNLKLLLIPTISRSPLPPNLLKNKISFAVLEENNEQDHNKLKGKDEVVFFINQNLSHFVPSIPVFPNITLKEKCLG